jgi:hypothetical protein
VDFIHFFPAIARHRPISDNAFTASTLYISGAR